MFSTSDKLIFSIFSALIFFLLPLTPISAQTTLSPDLLVRGLERGLYGEDVQELQKFLNQAGFPVAESGPGSLGEETTFFGNLTLDALKRFQQANPETYQSVGLEEPSGYFGPATRSKVVEVIETIPEVVIVSASPQVLERVFSYRPFVGREATPESLVFEPFRELSQSITQLQPVTQTPVTPTLTPTPTTTTAPITTTQVTTTTSRPGSNPAPSAPAPIVYATDLTNLEISGSPSNFSFSGSTYTYSGITVINDVTEITITPTGAGTITVDGVEVTSGEASDAISLTEAVQKSITIVVSESGKTSRTYTINITRNLRIAETPTFSPVAGPIAYGSTVTISSTGADAIYYTTDGSTPTTSSTNQAETPLVINSAITVKALAVKAGYTNSEIATASYTQAVSDNLTGLTISNSPSGYSFAGGTYTYEGITIPNAVESITITPTGTGTITVDGTEVTSGQASGAISLTAGVLKTVTVVVTETGKSAKTYTLNITRNSGVATTPSFSPVAGAVAFGTGVTISSEGADAIYYTTDGSDPTTSSTNQTTTPLVINSAVTVKALATKATFDNSSIASATYTQAASADLTNLVISNSPSNFSFAGGTYTYNGVSVLNGVSSITITPTGAGTIVVDGSTVVSGEASAPISLTAGVAREIITTATETGKSAKTYTLNITRAPPAPTSLSATAVSTSQINLAWTNTDASAETRIYRGGVLLTTVAAGVTTYQNTSLTAGTNYVYTVRHYINGVESADSVSANATTQMHCILSGGQNLSTGGAVTFTGSTSFTVNRQCTIRLRGIAGGGGGSYQGASYDAYGGGGGGGGAYSMGTVVTLQPSTTYSVTIGAGGASGAGAGSDGGQTIFRISGSTIFLQLGGGAGAGAFNGTVYPGGAGGTGIVGSNLNSGGTGGSGGNGGLPWAENGAAGSINAGGGGGNGGGGVSGTYAGNGGGNGYAGGLAGNNSAGHGGRGAEGGGPFGSYGYGGAGAGGYVYNATWGGAGVMIIDIWE